MRDFIKSLKHLDLKRPEEYADMPYVEHFIGSLTGCFLGWLGLRAGKRGDWHEVNHCIAALKAGTSIHTDESPCVLGADGQHRPTKGEHVLIGFEI